MKIQRESYPDRIRRIAQELGPYRKSYPVDHPIRKLQIIADELEQILKKAPVKKPETS
jgi:hypothetical protein